MYIGNTPSTSAFVSLTERFNGDNTTTDFTLSRTVYATGDIEVIVNNVQQDPFTAYTVSANALLKTHTTRLILKEKTKGSQVKAINSSAK